ncbi:hypothetical protein [Nonomuraea salmonea]
MVAATFSEVPGVAGLKLSAFFRRSGFQYSATRWTSAAVLASGAA